MPLSEREEQRLRSLEDWRRDVALELRDQERELRRHVEKYEPLVDAMRDQDNVSEALADAARSTRDIQREAHRVHLTTRQVTVGAVAAVCAVATLILEIAVHLR